MGDYGLAVTWSDTKPGREKQALGLWADSIGLNDKAVADGRLEKWDAIVFESSSPSGPAGAVRLYGTDKQIEDFIRSDDFQDVVVRGGTFLTGFSYRRFITGGAMIEAFGRLSAVVDSL